MKRGLTGVGMAVLGAATAATVLVIGSTTGAAQEGSSSAFGISIPALDLTLSEADSTGTQSDSLLAFPPDTGLPIQADAVTAEATGEGALARLGYLNLGDDQLIAKAIEVTCDADGGVTTLGELTLGEEFSENYQPEPNTTVVPEELSEIAQITFNRQTENADGSLTVDGLVIELASEEVVIVSSATCTPDDGDDGDNGDDGDDNGDDSDGDTDGDGGADGGDGPMATAPAPVTTGLPVTG